MEKNDSKTPVKDFIEGKESIEVLEHRAQEHFAALTRSPSLAKNRARGGLER